MGSLALAYGVKGLGEGMMKSIELDREREAEEAQTARDVQLQRMRDKAARERTEMEITGQRELQKERYASEANQLRERIEAESSESAKQQAHEIQVEQMRQQAQTNLEQMRLDVKEPTFEMETVEATRQWDPLTGTYKETPRQELLRDKMTGVSYEQKSVGGRPIFIPTTAAAQPTAGHVEAGSKMTNWLTTAPDQKTQIERLMQFQRLFRYVPPEYFSAYGRGFRTREQQKAGATVTAPATAQ